MKFKQFLAFVVEYFTLAMWRPVVHCFKEMKKPWRIKVAEEVVMCVKFRKHRKYLKQRLKNLTDEHILSIQDLDPMRNIWYGLVAENRKRRRPFFENYNDYHKAIIKYWKENDLRLHYMEDIGFIIMGTNDRSIANFMTIGTEIRVLHETIRVLTLLGVIKTKKGWQKSSGMDKIHGQIINTEIDLCPHGRARATHDKSDRSDDRPDRFDPFMDRAIELFKGGINVARLLRMELWDGNFQKLQVIGEQADREGDKYDKLIRPFPAGYGPQDWVNPIPDGDNNRFVWLMRPFVHDKASLLREIWLNMHFGCEAKASYVSHSDMDLLREMQRRNQDIHWCSQQFMFQTDPDVSIVKHPGQSPKINHHARFIVRWFKFGDKPGYYQVWWLQEFMAFECFFDKRYTERSHFIATQIAGGIHDEILTGCGFRYTMAPVRQDESTGLVLKRAKKWNWTSQFGTHMVQSGANMGHPDDARVHMPIEHVIDADDFVLVLN